MGFKKRSKAFYLCKSSPAVAQLLINSHQGDFPGGPIVLPMQGAWVQSLVRELKPICCN